MRSNWEWNRDFRCVGGGRGRHRRPAGGGLFGLLALLFCFRVGLVVLGTAGVLVCSLFTALAGALIDVIDGIGSLFAGSELAGGVAVGALIGLIAYRMIRAKKEEEKARQAEEDEPQKYDYAGEHSIRNYYT